MILYFIPGTMKVIFLIRKRGDIFTFVFSVDYSGGCGGGNELRRNQSGHGISYYSSGKGSQ